MKCPKCRTENQEDSKYCQECGANLKNKVNTTINTKKKKHTSKGDRKIILGILGVIVILILVAFVLAFTSSSDTTTNATKHFENQYISFDYSADRCISDVSGTRIFVSVDDPNGDSDKFILITNATTPTFLIDPSSSSSEIPQLPPLTQNITTAVGYPALKYDSEITTGYGISPLGAYIWANNKVYLLAYISTDSDISDRTYQDFNITLNSLKFKNLGGNDG